MSSDEEKRAIISRFRAQGVLLSPEELERLASTPMPSATITPADIAAFMRRRFDALRPLLAAKNTSVSIVHAAGNTTVIGMVRERTPQGFVVDDTTGTLSVLHENNQTQTGDIIAVSGWIREGQLIAQSIAYPDIPLSNSPVQLTDPLILTHPSTVPLPSLAVQTAPGRQTMVSTIPVRFASPAMLIHQPPIPLSPASVQQCLVRRFFQPAIPAGPDPLLLDALPSLIWLLQDTNWQKSYKGVLLLSTAPGHQVAISPDLTIAFQQTPV